MLTALRPAPVARPLAGSRVASRRGAPPPAPRRAVFARADTDTAAGERRKEVA
jgi:hypothetical protein